MDVIEEVKASLLALVLMGMTAAGCQSGPADTSARYDNAMFMDVWSTYNRCLSTEGLESAAVDSTKLQEVSRIQAKRPRINIHLPAPFKNLISEPSPRQAVDIHAMAASCSLHAGTLALSAGEHDLARFQFKQILDNPNQSDYSFYAAQARVRLAYLERTLQAAVR